MPRMVNHFLLDEERTCENNAFFCICVTSHFLRYLLAEKPCRLDQKNNDQDNEYDGV